jgi:biopolymer transport protein ExbB
MKNIFHAFAVLLLAGMPVLAQAWWNDDWAFRKSLIIAPDAGTVGDAPPVLLRLHPGNFSFFSDMRPDGGDIRFIAGDDRTPLRHRVERFDPANGMAFIWVEAPAAAAGGPTPGQIWMYYGNGAATSASVAEGLHDRNHALVWHFAEDGAPRDASGRGNHATVYSAEVNRAALIGGGARLNGDAMIQAPASDTLAVNAEPGWTFTAWVKIDAAQQGGTILHAQEGARALLLTVEGTALRARYAQDGTTVEVVAPGAELAPGSWHQVALVVGGAGIALYLDGVEKGVIAARPTLRPALTLGAAADGTRGLVGEIDEVTVSSVARDASWLSAQLRMQGVDAQGIAYGDDQGRESGGGDSYVSVLLKNVTFDGWVVIVILCVMFAISLLVMVVKTLFVGRARRENGLFIERFRSLLASGNAQQSLFTGQAMAADSGRYQGSNLYRIYEAGARELQHRLHAGDGAALTPQALSSIRATLDATMVREMQKLNSQMVLLTIAISGGPFLGLLGTVVGVMITFAAIALAGDVNVNAIAPGIAAALVATVAGLVVAIPALFGYNYLSSRIKEVSADMRVFADEYISRLTEQHG